MLFGCGSPLTNRETSRKTIHGSDARRQPNHAEQGRPRETVVHRLGNLTCTIGSAERGAQGPHIRSDALGAWLTACLCPAPVNRSTGGRHEGASPIRTTRVAAAMRALHTKRLHFTDTRKWSKPPWPRPCVRCTTNAYISPALGNRANRRGRGDTPGEHQTSTFHRHLGMGQIL